MILSHLDFNRDCELVTDVVIIGSGCGGAVMAKYLAEAGHEVIVAEEGSYISPDQYTKMSISEVFRDMYRDQGGILTIGNRKSPNVLIQQGKVVGGSSVINGGVSIRTPDFIIDQWRDEMGLTEFSHKEFEQAFSEVEKISQVAKTPVKLNNPGILKIQKVAAKRGYKYFNINRNMENCDGANRCIWTCPNDAKKHVLSNYLQHAIDRDARIISNFKINHIKHKNGIATGVSGTIVHPVSKRKLYKVSVRARLVIVAASAIFSPYLLNRSKIARQSKALGRNLTVHPGSRMYAIFDDPIEGWKGAFQSFAIEEFRKEGIHMINIFLPPSITTSTLPGVGREGYIQAQEYNRLAVLGVMVSDSPNGSIISTPFGPQVRYSLSQEDFETAIKGLKLAADMFFEAGARKVYFPLLTHCEISNVDDLSKVTPQSISPKAMEIASQHPMGTCRIGHDPKDSVVDPYHRVHGFKNLYVIDSSTVPSSVAVNPQITIMGMATRAAWYLLEQKQWQQI